MKALFPHKAVALALCATFALPMVAKAANIGGTVKFEGEKPKRLVVKMDADPKCAALHTKPVGTEDAIISKDGEVQNAFVYLKEVSGKFQPPADPATIDQHGCMYVPHVQGMMVNQPLNIVNSDPTLHNIHCLAKENPEFNFGQPTPSTRSDKKFVKPEKPVKFKCDVHPWMSAYVFVMEHPYFATTAKDGKFTIANVPDGDYTLVFWHEVLGTQEVPVKVAGGDVTQDHTFKK